MHFDCPGSAAFFMVNSRMSRLLEILVGSFPRGPCMRSLQMPCLRDACMKALVGGLGKDLVRSAPAGLLQFLVRRSCGDPSDMLSEAFA